MPDSRSFLIALLLALTGVPGAARAMEASPYAELAALEARVATIGYRLTTANAHWCAMQQPQFGWIWGDPRLYDDRHRAAALAAYGAGDADAAFAAAVASGSPAGEAGIRPGMAITTINGAPIPASGDDPFARVAMLETWLATFPVDAPVTVAGPSGQAIDITPRPGCASDFRVEARDRPAGGADGRLVLVSAGLARFAADDGELAAAVAHELAHNILRHPERLDAAGVNRGLLDDFGRSARLIRQTEVEADRLSVWLMAGAGYDPGAALSFWRRFGKRKGRVLIQAGTHPRWRARVAAIEEEIVALRAAEATGALPVPPLIAAPPPLE